MTSLCTRSNSTDICNQSLLCSWRLAQFLFLILVHSLVIVVLVLCLIHLFCPNMPNVSFNYMICKLCAKCHTHDSKEILTRIQHKKLFQKHIHDKLNTEFCSATLFGYGLYRNQIITNRFGKNTQSAATHSYHT